MKKFIAAGAAVLLTAAGLVAGFAGPASATDSVTPAEICIPSDAIDAYDEVTAEAYDEVITEAYDEEVSPAGWQRYSWTGGPIAEDADAPAFPGDDWQANTASDPHGVGVEGAYFRSNGGSGKGDWFYLEAIDAVIVHHEAEVVHHDAVTVHHDAVAAVVCDEEPEAFEPYEVTKRWLLPATWDYTVTPTYQESIFPQDELEGDVPACRWSQDDTYLLESEAEVALYESLDDDGLLTKDEDSSIYKSHTFTAGPACEETPPPVTNTCEAYSDGPTSTNLNDLWQNVDTRSAGHLEYVENGLHIWTDDNSSQAKVSEGYAASFDLANTGELDLDWTGTTPPPGINLFVTFEDGTNGTLVYESVYGQDLWLTNGSAQAAKDNAPVNGGGNGSQWHGTIDQWLSVYPDAHVNGIAYSLGSGVLGDGVINSITAGCVTYTFDFEEAPVIVPVTAQFDIEPTQPTCEVDGTLPQIFPIDREGYVLSVDRPFNGPGTYTVTATAKEGFVLEGSISKDIVVAGKLGSQETDPEAPCYAEPPVVEPPVVEPPVVEPPVTEPEPPLEPKPPVLVEQPAPVAQTAATPTGLASTGIDPTLGIVGAAMLLLLGAAGLLGRRSKAAHRG